MQDGSNDVALTGTVESVSLQANENQGNGSMPTYTAVIVLDPLPEGGAVIPRAELFAYDVAGVDDDGWVVGTWRACGIQPQHIKERMRAAGVWFDPAWFFAE